MGLLVPLLAGRYKFVRVIGQGQSSILVAAEVRKLWIVVQNNSVKSLLADQPVTHVHNKIYQKNPCLVIAVEIVTAAATVQIVLNECAFNTILSVFQFAILHEQNRYF